MRTHKKSEIQLFTKIECPGALKMDFLKILTLDRALKLKLIHGSQQRKPKKLILKIYLKKYWFQKNCYWLGSGLFKGSVMANFGGNPA